MMGYMLAAGLLAAFFRGHAALANLGETLGPDGAGALAIAVAVVAALAVPLGGFRSFRATGWGMLGLGLVLLAGALALGAANAFADRLGVGEFVVLTVLVRLAISRHLDGTDLTVSSGVLAALFCVHDALAQGLDPQRQMMMTVLGANLAAVAATTALCHGVALFHGRAIATILTLGSATGWKWAAVAVTLGVALLVAGLWLTAPPAVPDDLIPPPPLWCAAPLLGAALALALVDWPRPYGHRHVVTAGMLLAVPLPLYLVVPHVTPLVFR